MSELPPDKPVLRSPHTKTFILNNRFIVDVEFKPDLSPLRLPPEVIQLLLAEIGKMSETPNEAEEQEDKP